MTLKLSLALSCLLLAARAATADVAAEGHAWLTARLAVFNGHAAAAPEPRARQLVNEAVNLEAFGARFLGGYVERSLEEFEEHLRTDEFLYYTAVARQRLLAALEARLVRDLTTHLEAGRVDSLGIVSAAFDGDAAHVVLRADDPALACRLQRHADGGWGVVELTVDGTELSQRYRDRFAETFEQNYSPAVLEAQLRDRDYVILEDFSTSRPGEIPLGWRWRDKDEDKHKPYRVVRHDHQTYLAAADSGGSVILLRFAHWNPRDYPVMTWCWRVDALPLGGDERFGHTNDSAAGIYIFYSQTWIGMPRHIKYVWSTTLPAGTVGRRERIARPYYHVVESGRERLGEWLFAKVDLETSYDRTWGGRPKDRTKGLGLLTDANSTDSHAVAYYADLRVWSRQAAEAGRIGDHCGDLQALGSQAGDDASSGAMP